MRIETLEEFIVFAKLQNISAAARELHISQSALSEHMSTLEKELSLSLINRDQGMSLTPAGVVFLRGAQDTLALYNATLQKAHDAAQDYPEVRVNVGESLSREVVAHIRKSSIPVRAVETKEIPFQALLKEQLDVAFINELILSESDRRAIDKQSIELIPVGETTLAISLRSDNPLAQIEQLTSEDLINASIVIHSGRYFDAWKNAVQRVVGEGIPLNFVLDPCEPLSNIAFADLGESLHICGAQMLDVYMGDREDVVIKRALNSKPLTYQLFAAFCTNNKNPNVKRFVEELSLALCEVAL